VQSTYQNTGETPHINTKRIGNTDYNFRSAIEPTLYVAEHLFWKNYEHNVEMQSNVKFLTFLSTLQELPKSIIFIALRFL